MFVLKKRFVKINELTHIWGFFGTFPLILSACGGDKTSGSKINKFIGFPSDYRPPDANFNNPSEEDPFFKKLEPIYSQPYWIKALEMDGGSEQIERMMIENHNKLTYSFPTVVPTYVPVSIIGWAPASSEMISSSIEIFSMLEDRLDLYFERIELLPGFNDLALSQSIQAGTAGFSYFPNNDYKLGSDIFISKEFSSPTRLSNGLTNFDYEVLIHEIGHALGLKHPFESDRGNASVLSNYEDQTKFTVMSYDYDASTFNGDFRVLDWMILAKYYGVNSNFNANDNVYSFSAINGVFIFDGDGSDTINSSELEEDSFIDLRPGTHSYIGEKAIFITFPNQLTISHGSNIENVHSGSGNDTIIGNDLSNMLRSGAGNDQIFAGEGADIIDPGAGIDIIDLSESDSSEDKLCLDIYDDGKAFDTVYGFVQGVSGDTLDLTNLELGSFNFLPIVNTQNVPFGYIDNCIVRIFGERFNEVDTLGEQFNNGRKLENFKISENNSAILISANSQDTGENQDLYFVSNNDGFVEVWHMLQMVGNYLDIDTWTEDNFII